MILLLSEMLPHPTNRVQEQQWAEGMQALAEAESRNDPDTPERVLNELEHETHQQILLEQSRLRASTNSAIGGSATASVSGLAFFGLASLPETIRFWLLLIFGVLGLLALISIWAVFATRQRLKRATFQEEVVRKHRDLMNENVKFSRPAT